MFCVYLHFSHSVLVLVRDSAIHTSWDSRERHFFSSLLPKQPRFQANITSTNLDRFQSNLSSNRWHLPNMVSASWL